ncbi:rna-directed dna polymerase from mobile element jockey-like [Willisornis vidua]|uniref:Rna-directed dna polymerase from mobile element jockey-like n=1 Tax=Willisornis vidua TaxID=1566151 RepID=A0ABQ9CMU9_9PASS|nr:rna-directed dna polymerase from mobile element jockey-like [Willisornis vidua]
MERDLVVLVDKQFNVSEQFASAANKANTMPGCINKGITSRDKEITIPLYTVLVRPHLEQCSVLAPALEERYEQAEECPEKGSKDDQRTGKPAM